MKPSLNTPICLTIAGFDCCSGAGIQTDLNTFAQHLVYGLSVATCIVAETPHIVKDIHPVPIKNFQLQLDLLLDTYPISAIKIGLIPTIEHFSIILETLRPFQIPLIVDPILASTTGSNFSFSENLKLYPQLFKMASLVTPNIPEAESFLNTHIHADNIKEASLQFSKKFNTACLLKSGHLSNSLSTSTDYLTLSSGESHAVTLPKLSVPSLHGTGCTLSAAICSAVALKMPLLESVESSKKYLHKGMSNHHSWDKLNINTLAINHFQNKN